MPVWPLLGCLICLLAVDIPASARIFSRRPATGDLTVMLRELGGREVYSAAVRIEGHRAMLAITGFEDPVGAYAADIRGAFRLDAPFDEGDALYEIERDGIRARLLMLRPAPGRLLVVSIEPFTGIHERLLGGSRSVPSPLPVLPGATVKFQAENEDTGLYFATLLATGDPAAVKASYSMALSAAGWIPAFPEGTASDTIMALKGDAIAMVMAYPDSKGSVIVLLHKPLNRR